jgi:outer membrane protein TolC
MITYLVSEIAYAYYELIALDNQLAIVQANINIQTDALGIVTLQKQAGQVTELAVLRFQAEVNKNQSRKYYIEQRIIEAQNRINFLVGRFPRITPRNSQTFNQLVPDSVYSGIPSQILENRRDVKQAELDVIASQLDIKVAKANFYPIFMINAGFGFEAFNPAYLVSTPQSILFNLAGGLVAPVINRNAIKATYISANAKQIKAAYNYERTILNAFTEVVNQQANIRNLSKSYFYKAQQVDALSKSINISINLFKTARADYVEVLMTQRDALESKIELVETKKQQMNAMVKMYQVLGGGWR